MINERKWIGIKPRIGGLSSFWNLVLHESYYRFCELPFDPLRFVRVISLQFSVVILIVVSFNDCDFGLRFSSFRDFSDCDSSLLSSHFAILHFSVAILVAKSSNGCNSFVLGFDNGF
ncbi:hypothetical protein RIF29_34383 [Crotalaria pallida]|uniref:Uncharacterized protein n=1 Tax=Crotalaria pallida TaxID=3830 RepID=A0AAN9E962_CROPI